MTSATTAYLLLSDIELEDSSRNNGRGGSTIIGDPHNDDERTDSAARPLTMSM